MEKIYEDFLKKTLEDWKKNARPMTSDEAKIVNKMVRRMSKCIAKKPLKSASAGYILWSESFNQCGD